jgi:hypothetical protein
MININYQKRKNSNLFTTLENPDTTFLSKIQNYIPIYNKFFGLNESNYNNINLNHKWYLHNLKENIETNENLYLCSLKNINNEKIKEKVVFFKMAPLLDPYKYLIGKYDINNTKLFNLPQIKSTAEDVHIKILDQNNSAYVDGLFLFLSSQLLYTHDFIHSLDYYGSFLAIKNNYKLNVFDDLDYLTNSDFFNKQKNKLFKIDDYENFFKEKDTKKKPIKIDSVSTLRSIISIKSIDDAIFENIFESNNINENDNLNYNNLSSELLDINNSDLFLQVCDNKSTTLKSGSTCSSRTSHTSSNNSYINNEECDNCISDKEDNLSGNSDETQWEDDDSSSEYSEERIDVTIPNFPVEVICMENCDMTFDDLILNNELNENEWISAFMQIIMILITFQKSFSFTHNDLHTNNVMYNTTTKKFIYYCYKNKYYKVPTFGRIFKIIDFGRSIFKFDGKLFCSDSFQQGGDAATQYNTEPFFNDKKPRLEPNYSFDLCRLACSIFDYLIEDINVIKDLSNCDTITKLIIEWCSDDKGINLLYKNNGTDRYPDFKLYKMIARCVHNHTPQNQLERDIFKKFIVPKTDILNEKIVNIDEMPILI